MTNHIDLSALPAPRFAPQLSQAQVRTELLDEVQSRWPELTATVESEPIRIVLDAVAYVLWLWQERTNEAGKQTLLAFATGDNLTHLAAFYGVARLTDETDEALRHRVQLAPSALSVAGPEEAYEAHARGVEGVSDAKLLRTGPGAVSVAVLGDGEDRVPSAALLGEVRDALEDDDVRPVTDTVTVVAGAELAYGVTAVLSILSGPAVADVIAAATAALRAYAAEQSRLAVRVSRSGIIAALHVSGVWKVTLTAPAADVAPSFAQAPTLGAVDVTGVTA